MKVVILAGGKGARLAPYTTSFPKSLVPVGDRPILEIVIRQLVSQGFKDIILAVGHLSELIRAYFNEKGELGAKIKFSHEKKPLGTVGPLHLVRNELKDTFVLMNSDDFTDISYRALVKFHKEKGGIATISLARRVVNIDLGVVKIDKENFVSGWQEKPKINYMASMGIYVFEPEVFEYIKPNKRLDLPDLIKKLINAGKKVKGYIHDGYWLDIGSPEDYARACEDIKHLVKMGR